VYSSRSESLSPPGLSGIAKMIDLKFGTRVVRFWSADGTFRTEYGK